MEINDQDFVPLAKEKLGNIAAAVGIELGSRTRYTPHSSYMSASVRLFNTLPDSCFSKRYNCVIAAFPCAKLVLLGYNFSSVFLSLELSGTFVENAVSNRLPIVASSRCSA